MERRKCKVSMEGEESWKENRFLVCTDKERHGLTWPVFHSLTLTVFQRQQLLANGFKITVRELHLNKQLSFYADIQFYFNFTKMFNIRGHLLTRLCHLMKMKVFFLRLLDGQIHMIAYLPCKATKSCQILRNLT